MSGLSTSPTQSLVNSSEDTSIPANAQVEAAAQQITLQRRKSNDQLMNPASVGANNREVAVAQPKAGVLVRAKNMYSAYTQAYEVISKAFTSLNTQLDLLKKAYETGDSSNVISIAVTGAGDLVTIAGTASNLQDNGHLLSADQMKSGINPYTVDRKTKTDQASNTFISQDDLVGELERAFPVKGSVSKSLSKAKGLLSSSLRSSVTSVQTLSESLNGDNKTSLKEALIKKLTQDPYVMRLLNLRESVKSGGTGRGHIECVTALKNEKEIIKLMELSDRQVTDKDLVFKTRSNEFFVLIQGRIYFFALIADDKYKRIDLSTVENSEVSSFEKSELVDAVKKLTQDIQRNMKNHAKASPDELAQIQTIVNSTSEKLVNEITFSKGELQKDQTLLSKLEANLLKITQWLQEHEQLKGKSRHTAFLETQAEIEAEIKLTQKRITREIKDIASFTSLDDLLTILKGNLETYIEQRQKLEAMEINSRTSQEELEAMLNELEESQKIEQEVLSENTPKLSHLKKNSAELSKQIRSTPALKTEKTKVDGEISQIDTIIKTAQANIQNIEQTKTKIHNELAIRQIPAPIVAPEDEAPVRAASPALRPVSPPPAPQMPPKAPPAPPAIHTAPAQPAAQQPAAEQRPAPTGDRGSLLAAIQKGTSLKKVTQNQGSTSPRPQTPPQAQQGQPDMRSALKSALARRNQSLTKGGDNSDSDSDTGWN